MVCYNCNAKRLKYNSEKDSYICLNCGYEYPKQYFFISHSHLDIEKVRLIRNTIEETFFYEPILFFLKCISDDNELQDLLQREISERIWFVYCKSENAEKSKYVQQEREYVNNLIKNGKKIHIVEVELDKYNIWDNRIAKYLKSQISFQIKKTKLFICYSRNDRDIFTQFEHNLMSAGYSVWDLTNNLSFEQPWNDSLITNIQKHSHKDGAILFLVTDNSLNNEFLRGEVLYAVKQGATILPIIVYKNQYQLEELQQKLKERFFPLAYILSIYVRQDAINEDIEKLINGLKSF